MKINRLMMALLISLIVAGCASDSSRQKESDQKAAARKLKLAARVRIVIYDSSPRAESDRLDIFDETRPIQRPYKDIALLTCEGTPGEEAEMTQAIIDHARRLGANAVVILPPSRSGWGDRRVFRVKAVVDDTSAK
jgi:hypothetical protein